MSRLHSPVTREDHIRGSLGAPIRLVEYGDFECVFCGRAEPEVRHLLLRLGDRMCLVFRHFPLAQIHPHALEAAEASEAAGAQGQFWEMHDLLFENQDRLDRASLVSYAEELSLDLDRFVLDLNEQHALDRIRRDLLSGARSGVNGTPTFFINGRRHEGAFAADDLLEAIQGGPAASAY